MQTHCKHILKTNRLNQLLQSQSHLGSQVLKDCSSVHGCGSTNALLVSHESLQETVDTSHGEGEASSLRTRLGGLLGGGALAALSALAAFAADCNMKRGRTLDRLKIIGGGIILGLEGQSKDCASLAPGIFCLLHLNHRQEFPFVWFQSLQSDHAILEPGCNGIQYIKLKSRANCAKGCPISP